MISDSSFEASQAAEFDAVAFGCPSIYGVEQLEEDEFESMFTACENQLGGRRYCSESGKRRRK